MSIKIAIIILIILIIVCALLFGSVVYIKLRQAAREIKRKKDTRIIKPVLRRLFTGDIVYFFKNQEKEIQKLTETLNDKDSIQTLEDLLLMELEDAGADIKLRANAIAYSFGFPENSLSMIRDRITSNIAIGCRKAGLYQYKEAIPDILDTLNIVSSNTQLQALMALSRIGDSAAMIQAFDKIHRLILVNERAVNETLAIFSGDRYELFRQMLHHDSPYLVRLFLKSMDRETAGTLIEDIALICENRDKETRLAGIIAIGKAGKKAKIRILIDALNDKEWEIRAMAARTLGVLTGPIAIKPLRIAACDREWWVRQNAVTSILAYPNHDRILASVIKTGDKYAYDSIQHILEKNDDKELLSVINNAWANNSAPAPKPVQAGKTRPAKSGNSNRGRKVV